MKSLLANAAAIACLTAAVSITLYRMDDATAPSGRSSSLHSDDVRAGAAPPSSGPMIEVENSTLPRRQGTSAVETHRNSRPARPSSPSHVAGISSGTVADGSPASVRSTRRSGVGSQADSHAESFNAFPQDAGELRETRPDHARVAGITRTAASPAEVKPAIATVLLDRLPPEVFDSLTAHEQLAITELGNYAKDAVENPETSPQSPDEGPVWEETPPARAARIWSEADAYLRATLGFARFNQLSALASGLVSSSDPVPSP
ncbi:hypothetical protein JIN84_06385 [Luteolibacter yonseiensis]|uniref:Uncharacterized protein n=1 Tax=Luteolibacter yonseiensis TaxID=1144680 RepID=A0A934R1U5_9BACT|nr:hypothetical protein [Luteolibacter yonseiensis]MBK1815232.1 hypothetical protein [Luteolibacter yonseiensis]